MPAILTIAALNCAGTAQAEISGSGSPNANCASARVGGAVTHEISGSGLHGIVISLADDQQVLTAVTGADGLYLFSGLCAGDYELALDLSSVPDGLSLFSANVPRNDDDDDTLDRGTADWEIELAHDDTELLDVDFAFSDAAAARCALDIEAGCSVVSLASELYVCSKKVTELSMTWQGGEEIRVVAYNGKPDDEVLTDVDLVAPGDTVTVTGMDDPPDNVHWEIYQAGTDVRVGESVFRLNCDDAAMDGPEDCGLPQGNGKDDKPEFVNTWELAGLQDASGRLSCAEPAYTETCAFQPERADCDRLEELFALTFVYQGGACADSRHHQPEKFECSGSVDPAAAALVTLEDGSRFMVQPGEAFSIAPDGSDTDIVLSNAGGEQAMRIHTSCSKPLATGDVYGALHLGSLNGIGHVIPVDFQYLLTNDGAASAVEIGEDIETLQDPTQSVGAQTVVALYGSAWLSESSTNTVVAEGSAQCAATDLVSAVFEPLPDCTVSGTGREFHDKEIRWRLRNDDAATATVERIEISWPAAIAGKLKEMSFEGDKFFDQDVITGSFVVDADTLEGEVKKRRLKRNTERQFKIKFDQDIEDLPGDYSVTVHFEEGCSISW